MKNHLRAILGGTSAAAIITAGAVLATPAQADVVASELGFIDTQTCEDAGGVPYTVSVDWNYKYEDAAGVTRVSVNPLVVERDDADAGKAADAGVDLHFDVGDRGFKANVQHKLFDGLDLDFAADDQASFNPRNPRSNAGLTQVRVKVGTDGDGLANCPWLTFVQPSGIGDRV